MKRNPSRIKRRPKLEALTVPKGEAGSLVPYAQHHLLEKGGQPNVLELMENSPGCLRFWNGEWYRWDGRAYRKTSADAVKKQILAALHQRGSVSRAAVNSTLEMMRLATLVESPTVPCWLSEKPKHPAGQIVAVRNGLLHLPSVLRGCPVLLPHSPTFFNLNALSYDFQSNAACPQWERFLAELWCDDVESIRALQEWCGYLLLPDTSQQKLLMLLGPPRSGKGTIARIIRMMLGEANVASPTIRSLSGVFGLWGLVGKSLAIVPDASLRASSNLVELIKCLTGEDALDVERKNLGPLSSVNLTSRLMVIANDLPQMADPSGALAERMIILATTKSFAGNEDKNLTAKLAKELPGILLWAIQGWRRLRKRGHFRQPKSSSQLVERYGRVPLETVGFNTIPHAPRKTPLAHNLLGPARQRAPKMTVRRTEITMTWESDL
jgi:putative DNA primase/helicase